MWISSYINLKIYDTNTYSIIFLLKLFVSYKRYPNADKFVIFFIHLKDNGLFLKKMWGDWIRAWNPTNPVPSRRSKNHIHNIVILCVTCLYKVMFKLVETLLVSSNHLMNKKDCRLHYRMCPRSTYRHYDGQVSNHRLHHGFNVQHFI